MASINISLREEAYEFLKARKTDNKSFSDVVLEFKGNTMMEKGSKEAVLRFFGGLEHVDWESRENAMKRFRKNFARRLG